MVTHCRTASAQFLRRPEASACLLLNDISVCASLARPGGHLSQAQTALPCPGPWAQAVPGAWPSHLFCLELRGPD